MASKSSVAGYKWVFNWRLAKTPVKQTHEHAFGTVEVSSALESVELRHADEVMRDQSRGGTVVSRLGVPRHRDGD
jgi:hypothetical protein